MHTEKLSDKKNYFSINWKIIKICLLKDYLQKFYIKLSLSLGSNKDKSIGNENPNVEPLLG